VRQIRTFKEATFLVVGEGTDAPGFRIVPDGKGGWKIVPVPGWDPEQMRELASAVRVVAAAGRIKHAAVSRRILKSAADHALTEIGGLIGKEARGAQAVIVVA
jgi:hypothetical protein